MTLDSTAGINGIPIDPERKLFSATHEEILSGATTDIYFLRSRDILARLGLLDTPVRADVFARKPGMICGVEEVRRLLQESGAEIHSLAEGERFEPGETVMRISGPYGAFGIFETTLLGILASESGWATAAAECKHAAGDCPVVCFGARHIHPAAAPAMERAAIIGGVDGCSCIIGALLAGKQPTGTVPHAAIIIAGDTVRIARAFDEVFPDDVPRIILVDTFKDEAEETLRVAEALGEKLAAVRLDTPSERGGVTPELVREVRSRLDQAGHAHVAIVVSGGVTPDRIRTLRAAGAALFGVGSYISAAAPIEMTMDIKEVNGKPIAKRGRIPGCEINERLKKIL